MSGVITHRVTEELKCVELQKDTQENKEEANTKTDKEQDSRGGIQPPHPVCKHCGASFYTQLTDRTVCVKKHETFSISCWRGFWP